MVKKRLTYKVQRGDDYTRIADKLYGDKRYRTALKRQNPKVKRPRPGMVIDLLDDDPKEMWKKRERGRRRQAASMRKDWESVKRRYGINPDLSEIEPTPIAIQPPANIGDDLANEDELINLLAETAQSMGLDVDAMLYEWGLGEDPYANQTLGNQPQDAAEVRKPKHRRGGRRGGRVASKWTPGETLVTPQAPSTTPAMTDEQLAELKAKLAEMGLDESAMLYEFGLSASNPAASNRVGGTSGRRKGGGDIHPYNSLYNFVDKNFRPIDEKGNRYPKGDWKKEFNQLEFLADMIDLAFALYGDDWVEAITFIVNGDIDPKSGFGTLQAAQNHLQTEHFVFYDSFFHEDFRDETSQVTHFWPIFANAIGGPIDGLEASIGNYVHDVLDSSGSIEDYALGVVAIELAGQISNGRISPSDFANMLRDPEGPLGSEGSGSGGFVQAYSDTWPVTFFPGSQNYWNPLTNFFP